jgi:hypothetical protein
LSKQTKTPLSYTPLSSKNNVVDDAATRVMIGPVSVDPKNELVQVGGGATLPGLTWGLTWGLVVELSAQFYYRSLV